MKTVLLHLPEGEEPAFVYEQPRPQRRRGTVTATRLVLRWNRRNYRLYSDRAETISHFIQTKHGRLAVTEVPA